MCKEIKEIYNNILKDSEIIEQYRSVEIYEEKAGGWAFHNIEHVKNVSLIVESILKELGFDKEFIYKAKIACILHDTGAIKGKEGHAYRSYEYSRKYFESHNIVFEDMELVLEAIKIHSNGFDTDNIIALALIFADKLDIKKTRISEEGKKAIGNRQYYHINDIKLNLSNSLLYINFITDGNINMQEINEYYFTKKVFKAIQAFSNKLNLKYEILIDNEIWTLYNEKEGE